LFYEFGVPRVYDARGGDDRGGQLFANVGAKDGVLPAGYSCRQVMDNRDSPRMAMPDALYCWVVHLPPMLDYA
jgi:hypothetical protein